MKTDNLFLQLPPPGRDESFHTLAARNGTRIERIVSHGHCSPPGFWYDQAEHEWVALLRGEAVLHFEDGDRRVRLREGDCLEIPAHARHRVEWTDPDRDTVWLAVFY